MQKSNSRMIAPDILKILASIFVVVIHHKEFKWQSYAVEYIIVHIALLVSCVIIGVIMYFKERKTGRTSKSSLSRAAIPFFVFVGFWLFKKFPVTIFILLSAYFMGKSFLKSSGSVGKWYKMDNIIPRILRFYIPFVPIFILCIIYKIFILKYEYTAPEVIARFVLGGFKPGSYYVPILAQMVLIFPIVFVPVFKYRTKAVAIAVLFTFVYDYLTAKLGFSDVAYKFIVFRFVAHIALGAYASVTDFKISNKSGLAMFCVGFVYACLCVYSGFYKPPIFFQWQETSFITAFYLYPVICFVMNKYRDSSYSDSRISSCIKAFAGATYHIFLVQLMFYTTFGFALNDYIANYIINIPLNLTLTVIPGIVYAYYSIPFENKLISKVKNKFLKT